MACDANCFAIRLEDGMHAPFSVVGIGSRLFAASCDGEDERRSGIGFGDRLFLQR
jgi:hypothetical protein